MSEIVVSAPGAAAQQQLWRLVGAAQRADALEPVSVVVPSTIAGLQLRRSFGGRAGFANVRMLLGHELAFAVAQPRLARLGLTPRPPLLERELVRAAMHDAADGVAQTMASLRGLATHPATVDAVTATLADLAGVDDAALARLDARGGRAAMIAAVERARRARAGHTYDRERLFREAAAALEAGEVTAGALGHVVLYAPHRPSPGTAAFWRALVARGAVDAVVIGLDDDVATAFESPCTDLLAALLGGAQPAHLALPEPPERGHAVIVDGPSAHDEVRWIAADLSRRAAEGMRLAEAAIVVRAADVYTCIVDQVLGAASIPWVGRSPHTLGTSSTGRVLLGALKLAGEAIHRDSLFRWLASGPVLDPAAGAYAPAPSWDVVSRRAGVVGGGEEWTDRLGRHAQEQRATGSMPEADAADALLQFVTTLEADLAPPDESHVARVVVVGTVDRAPLRRRARRRGRRRRQRRTRGARPGGRDRPRPRRARPRRHHTHARSVHAHARGRARRAVRARRSLRRRRVRGRAGRAARLPLRSGLRGRHGRRALPAARPRGSPPRRRRCAAAHEGVPLQRDRWARERADHLHAIGAAPSLLLSFPRADVREERAHRPAPLLLETASTLAGEPVGADALLGLDAPWCTHVASFGASLHDRPGPAPLGEALVRALDARRHAQLDPATHPALAPLPVVARGFQMVAARAADVYGEYDGVIGPVDGFAAGRRAVSHRARALGHVQLRLLPAARSAHRRGRAA